MDAVSLFKALAEPIRLRILHLLANTEPEMCVCDLVTVLDVPQGTVSRHLTQLRHLDLVIDRRSGQWVYYRLAPPEARVHATIIGCLKTCLADDATLSKDLQRYSELKASEKLACCAPDTSKG